MYNTSSHSMLPSSGYHLATMEAAQPLDRSGEPSQIQGDRVVKRVVKLVIVAVMTLGLLACASERERYFKQNVNQVSQDAVAKRFGPPTHTQELTTGETVWSYESRDGSDCTAYILTFDRTKVLRDWKEQKC